MKVSLSRPRKSEKSILRGRSESNQRRLKRLLKQLLDTKINFPSSPVFQESQLPYRRVIE